VTEADVAAQDCNKNIIKKKRTNWVIGKMPPFVFVPIISSFLSRDEAQSFSHSTYFKGFPSFFLYLIWGLKPGETFPIWNLISALYYIRMGTN